MSTLKELAALQVNRRNDNKKILEEKRKVMYACAASANQALLSSINDGVAQVHENEKQLEIESKKLHDETAAFVKQTSQWLNMYKRLNNSMNELGDVETWAKRIQAEMKTVASSIEYVTEVENRNNDTTDDTTSNSDVPTEDTDTI
jgi:biogenesis of lysosome-related organelles complex 1 subunit 1